MGVLEAGYPLLYGYGYPAGGSSRIPIPKIKNGYGYAYPAGDSLRKEIWRKPWRQPYASHLCSNFTSSVLIRPVKHDRLLFSAPSTAPEIRSKGS